MPLPIDPLVSAQLIGEARPHGVASRPTRTKRHFFAILLLSAASLTLSACARKTNTIHSYKGAIYSQDGTWVYFVERKTVETEKGDRDIFWHPDTVILSDEVWLRRVNVGTGAVENVLHWPTTPHSSVSYTAMGWNTFSDFLMTATLEWRPGGALRYDIRIGDIRARPRDFPGWKTEGEQNRTDPLDQERAGWTEPTPNRERIFAYFRTPAVMAVMRGSLEVIEADTKDGSAALLLYDHRVPEVRVLLTEPVPDFKLSSTDIYTFEGWSRLKPSILWYATHWSRRLDIIPDDCTPQQLQGIEPAQPFPADLRSKRLNCFTQRLIARALAPDQVQRLMHQAALFPMLDLPSKKIPPNSMALVQAAIAQPGVQIPEPPDDSHALDAFNIIPVFYVRDREHTYEMRTVPRKGRP